MPTLTDHQDAALRTLLRPDAGSRGEHARWEVHRRNVVGTLVGALRAAFPATRALLGGAAFDTIAAAFARARPPRQAELIFYGAEFPDFPWPGARDLDPRAGALARLEWLTHAAAFGRDASVLPLAALAALAPREAAGLRLRPHPTATLTTLTHPVLGLWAAAHGRPMAPDEAGATRVLVVRPRWQVHAAGLGPGAFALLSALGGGATLLAAAAGAAEAEPGFDLRGCLAHHLGLGTFGAVVPAVAAGATTGAGT